MNRFFRVWKPALYGLGLSLYGAGTMALPGFWAVILVVAPLAIGLLIRYTKNDDVVVGAPVDQIPV